MDNEYYVALVHFGRVHDTACNIVVGIEKACACARRLIGEYGEYHETSAAGFGSDCVLALETFDRATFVTVGRRA